MVSRLFNNMIHIGKLIELRFREQGHTVTWFAKQLCCTRANVYKIFCKDNIDVDLLMRISHILRYDFFLEISRELISGVYQSETEM